jgi:murein DD-endopeptidase MepM/ murein hydrolase activator NlpD
LGVADRIDWPVGVAGQRSGKRVPGGWYIAVGFDQDYILNGRQQVHPGIDLNRVTGGDTDLGEPVYAVADGVVTAAAHYRVWGNVVLVRHSLPDGSRLWSQYAHLDRIHVRGGQAVERGWQIGTVGKGDGGRYSAHLHFEIRVQDLAASYWPGTGRGIVRQAYRDPTALMGWSHDGGGIEPPQSDLESQLRSWADVAQIIHPNERAALWGTIKADGYYPISDEGDVAAYRAQLARDLQGRSERIYFAREDEWHSVLWIERGFPRGS